MASESNCPVVVLASGQTLPLQRVLLYDETAVKEIIQLRAQAAKNLGGASTRIGFWGSRSWVLGGAAQKDGLQMLQLAEAKYKELAVGAYLFHTSTIRNIHSPYPQAWSAFGMAKRNLEVTNLRKRERREVLARYNKSASDLVWRDSKQLLQVEQSDQRFVHNGDEFVTVEVDAGIISVRWSNVTAYIPPQPTP